MTTRSYVDDLKSLLYAAGYGYDATLDEPVAVTDTTSLLAALARLSDATASSRDYSVPSTDFSTVTVEELGRHPSERVRGLARAALDAVTAADAEARSVLADGLGVEVREL